MVDAYYNDAPNNFLGNGVHGNTDLDTDDIRIVLYDEGADARNLTDADIADIIAGARIATSPNLTTKEVGVVADGIFNHADEVFATVTGSSVESLLYFEFNATESIAPLLFVLDSWTGLPVTPNGGDITAAPAAGGVLDIS
jgi:hypothetical protein